MKKMKNKNVTYEIWFLEGLSWADSLLWSLRHPFPQALLLGGLCGRPWTGCEGEWHRMGP